MLAIAFLSSWVFPTSSSTTPAIVTLVAERSNDLDVHPVTGPLAVASLWPAAHGLRREIEARNATGGTLVVRLRAVPKSHTLDRVLAVRLRLGDRTLFDGSLADLHRDGSRSFSLASHKTIRIELRAWIPAGRSGWDGRAASVPLSFETRPAESA